MIMSESGHEAAHHSNIQCSFHLSVFLDSTQYLDPDFLHLHDLKLNFLKLVAGGKTIVLMTTTITRARKIINVVDFVVFDVYSVETFPFLCL